MYTYTALTRYDIRHEEAYAVSRAQRIISGEGAVRLWRDLSLRVVQVALAQALLAAHDRRANEM